MKIILSYIQKYFYDVDKRVLVAVTLLTAALIFANYFFDVDYLIRSRFAFLGRWALRFCIFIIAFGLPYLFYLLAFQKKKIPAQFIFLLLAAPAIFAFKTSLDLVVQLSDNPNWNKYWEHVIYWPLLVILTGAILYFIWRIFDRDQSFYGLTTRNMNWRPYWIMLAIMLPLVAAASTQHDFLQVYPKLKLIAQVYDEPGLRWWHKLFFELSYGSDFITIELFFRGFLILAFMKWFGKDAILPMACFYCTIHFGKPLGECISSYFGGIILGIVVYNTRSILGGLMVHLGIAWLMELGGYIGNSFFGK